LTAEGRYKECFIVALLELIQWDLDVRNRLALGRWKGTSTNIQLNSCKHQSGQSKLLVSGSAHIDKLGLGNS